MASRFEQVNATPDDVVTQTLGQDGEKKPRHEWGSLYRETTRP